MSDFTGKKYDLLTRKDAEALAEDTKREIEAVLASFGRRLTDGDARVTSTVQLATDWHVEQEYRYHALIGAMSALVDRIEILERRTFTARWRALLRKLSWKRNGSPLLSSAMSSSSPSPTLPPTAWDVDTAWPTPSERQTPS